MEGALTEGESPLGKISFNGYEVIDGAGGSVIVSLYGEDNTVFGFVIINGILRTIAVHHDDYVITYNGITICMPLVSEELWVVSGSQPPSDDDLNGIGCPRGLLDTALWLYHDRTNIFTRSINTIMPLKDRGCRAK